MEIRGKQAVVRRRMIARCTSCNANGDSVISERPCLGLVERFDNGNHTYWCGEQYECTDFKCVVYRLLSGRLDK